MLYCHALVSRSNYSRSYLETQTRKQQSDCQNYFQHEAVELCNYLYATKKLNRTVVLNGLSFFYQYILLAVNHNISKLEFNIYVMLYK